MTSQGTCAHNAGIVTCDLGTADGGSTATIVIVVIPTVNAGGNTITNRASVTSTVADLKEDNDATQQQTVVIRSVDLSVELTGTPDPVDVGGTLTYAVTVTNTGPSLATGVVLTGSLPANTTFGSATPSQGNCDLELGTLTCVLGAMLRNANAVIGITVTPLDDAAGATIANMVSVTAAEIDPDQNNNTASQNTTVNPSADISVNKTDNSDPVTAGEGLRYTVTVSNSGPSDSTGVTLTDILPPGVNFVSAAPTQGNCSGTRTVTCTLGTLANGKTATVSILVVTASIGELTNIATVSGSVRDPSTGNNAATEITTVNPKPGGFFIVSPITVPPAVSVDLAVTMIDSPKPVLIGSNLTYTVIVTNHGPSG